MNTATGFDFQPLPDGNVLIEFFGDGGKTLNKQIVTAEVIRQMPVVAALWDLAMRMGPEMAGEIVERLTCRRFKTALNAEGETIMTVFVVKRLDLSDHTVVI